MENVSVPVQATQFEGEEEVVRCNHPSATTTTRTSVAAHPISMPSSSPYKVHRLQATVGAILDTPFTTIFMSLITAYVLFSDDMRMLVATVHNDDAFYVVASICMGIFTVEIVLSVYAKPGYLNSFYFYLDILSTVFMITDIGWAWDVITNTETTDQGNQASQVKNASVTSRTATRGVRIVRIVRLVRLIRLVKLYKNAQIAIKRRNQRSTVIPEDAIFPQESKIGKRLSELTTMRVIFLVLVLLVLLPLFELDLYYDNPTSGEFSLVQLSKFYGSPSFQICLDEMLSYKVVSTRPLILLSYSFDTYTAIYTSMIPINDLRMEEKYYAANGDFVAIYDIRVDTQMSAGLSICRTVFVAIVMTLAAIYFTRDAQKLVIEPIEKMMRKVAKIAKDPIHATEEKMVDIFEEDPREDTAKTCFCCKKEAEPQHFETQLLEDTLLKISTLLGLGFGEAGAKMIGQNLARNQDLDLMLDGTKIIAIFGFCDIRNFTDTTEVLREDVMLFVNQIANIVHTTVATCMGTANKNIGDAFLLVWKFDPEDIQLRGSSLFLDEKSHRVMHLCDLSLISFLKIIVKIHTHRVIDSYRKHPGLLARMPEYRVKMGFGLHLGWAIEGAIGSDLKIDASYLSPHVNMSSRLEAATKQYGVPLLLSGSLVHHMSIKAQSYCRHIDTVTVKGSNEPEELYTSDIDTSELTAKEEEHSDKAIATQKRRELERRIGDTGFDATMLLDRSKGIQKLRKKISQVFLDTFEEGVAAYISGDWPLSKTKLESALETRPKDGPSQTLLEVMKEYDFLSPKEWPGYRALTEK